MMTFNPQLHRKFEASDFGVFKAPSGLIVMDMTFVERLVHFRPLSQLTFNAVMGDILDQEMRKSLNSVELMSEALARKLNDTFVPEFLAVVKEEIPEPQEEEQPEFTEPAYVETPLAQWLNNETPAQTPPPQEEEQQEIINEQPDTKEDTPESLTEELWGLLVDEFGIPFKEAKQARFGETVDVSLVLSWLKQAYNTGIVHGSDEEVKKKMRGYLDG